MYNTSIHRTELNDKNTVISILTNAFADNKSVNYVIKQDKSRLKRLQRLMSYSFEYCNLFGEIYLSDDRKGCALVVFPDKKKTTLKSILLDVKLALSCVGLLNIKKVLAREAKIKSIHPRDAMCHLWFIGVLPAEQNKGIGSSLLSELIKRSNFLCRHMYLETSTVKNICWYKQFGFEIYNELDFGYKLFCLKRES